MDEATRIFNQIQAMIKAVKLPAHERAARKRRTDTLKLPNVPGHRFRTKAPEVTPPARKTWDVRGIGFPPTDGA